MITMKRAQTRQVQTS